MPVELVIGGFSENGFPALRLISCRTGACSVELLVYTLVFLSTSFGCWLFCGATRAE